ncbi:dnaJsubfamily B member 13-like [Dorcoceras hygrometricum]|uniref:DnaJsubfamily B member 13-like n=1 Tax=Dorcoceras hygrometricum TaxID=472368 RepID=A0A2Z7AH06_9LAMI|nr:dnaJsubfamily B member 13-like [Dorcoceras hygrometricum]
MAAAAANIACGAWPHAAVPSAALPHSTVRQPWRTSCRPPHNNLRVAAGHSRPACSNPGQPVYTYANKSSQLVPVATSKQRRTNLSKRCCFALNTRNKTAAGYQRYQLSLNTTHPDFTKTTAFDLPRYNYTLRLGFATDQLLPQNQLLPKNPKIRKLPELLKNCENLTLSAGQPVYTYANKSSQLVPVATSKQRRTNLSKRCCFALNTRNKTAAGYQRYQLSLNTTHPDFTKTTAFDLPRYNYTLRLGFATDQLLPQNQLLPKNTKITKTSRIA